MFRSSASLELNGAILTSGRPVEEWLTINKAEYKLMKKTINYWLKSTLALDNPNNAFISAYEICICSLLCRTALHRFDFLEMFSASQYNSSCLTVNIIRLLLIITAVTISAILTLRIPPTSISDQGLKQVTPVTATTWVQRNTEGHGCNYSVILCWW